MNAHPHLLQRFTNIKRVRHGLEQIAADGVESVEFAAVCGIDHGGGVVAGNRGERRFPKIRKALSVLDVDFEAAGIFRRIDTALATTLYSAVPPNRHDAALLASEIAA